MLYSSRRNRKTKAIAEMLAMIASARPLTPHRADAADAEESLGESVAEFCAALERRKWAVVPQFGNRHGHPIVFGREMIEAFLEAPPSATARAIEHQHEDKIEYLEVDDPEVIGNINTPEEYAALCAVR